MNGNIAIIDGYIWEFRGMKTVEQTNQPVSREIYLLICLVNCAKKIYF